MRIERLRVRLSDNSREVGYNRSIVNGPWFMITLRFAIGSGQCYCWRG
jgi:hypothetical protein